MERIKDVIDCLSRLDQYDQVGIDDGGLALRSLIDPTIYYEIGGMPVDRCLD